MECNLADIFEMAVDQYPDREYIVAEGKRCTYREMDERANQLAHHLASRGIGPGDHVGIYAYNCMEWVETLWAVFKIRAVWVNINYRYVDDELSYLFDNADLKALVFQRQFADHINRVAPALSALEHTLVIEDGSQLEMVAMPCEAYEAAIEGQSAERDFAPRSGDDRYIVYTGGTTGMPKGVVWRHHDVYYALGGGVDQTTGLETQHPQEVLDRGKDFQVCMYPLAPLMHGASQWAVMGGAFEGRKVVLSARFEPDQIWPIVESEKVNGIFITGDAMARPLIEAYEQARDTVDASSLFILSSSSVVFSADMKDQFLEHFPNMMIFDSIGSSETGGNGTVMAQKGTAMKGGPTVKPGHGSLVLDPQTLEPIVAGSGKTGMIARAGYIPIGYYKDERKTAETFVTAADGTRYAMPGDFATVEEDGTITMLGRGSVCINSGGEKIFPEEVESAVKTHPQVYDVTVVGVPDPRWGSRVTAVVQPRPGCQPELESIQTHCRQKIAGYKIPRELHLVEHIERSPSGKPDYRWARDTALAATTAEGETQ